MSTTGAEPEFRQMFADQTGPSLDQISHDLLELEDTQDNQALVDSLFRAAHTIKGGAAMVGFEDVRGLAHAMEDVLDAVRTHRRAADSDTIDALLSGADRIKQLIPPLVAGDQPDVAAADLIESLRGLAGEPGSAPTQEPKEPPPKDTPPTVGPPTQKAAAPGETSVQMPAARLDEIVHLVGEGSDAHVRLGRQLGRRLGRPAQEIGEFRELSTVIASLRERASRARMVPVAVLAESMHRAARDVSRDLGKKLRWSADGTETELDRAVAEQLAGPLLHLARNAIDHGIEGPQQRMAAGKPDVGHINFHARQAGPEVLITIEDDGAGIDLDKVRRKAGVPIEGPGSITDDEARQLIFRTGLSTSEKVTAISGRGVGLDVVKAAITAINGKITVSSRLGYGTEFRISVPLTLTVLRCLLMQVGQYRCAVPLHAVATVLPAREGGDVVGDLGPALWLEDDLIPVSGLVTTIDAEAEADRGPAVVICDLGRRHAFRVKKLLGQRDVVVAGMSAILPRLDIYTGLSAEPDGSMVLVLDPGGLVDRAESQRNAPRYGTDGEPTAASRSTGSTPAPQPTILVVDDTLTIRELQAAILRRAGYRVLTAADGQDALRLAESNKVELILTDIQMPGMDGIALIQAIRSHPHLAGVGIAILTAMGSADDRAAGMAAGADAYLIKSDFNEAALLDCVQRVLGEHE